MKSRSRIPSPSSSRLPSGQSGFPNPPGSPAPLRRPESVNTSGSILDWAASGNTLSSKARSVYNDAGSTQGDDYGTLDSDRNPVGSVARGMASMGLGPERPPTPPNEPKSSKMRSNILVAVRMRPLSDKERGRGDHEMWMLDEQNNIGCYGKDGSFVPKHRYDTVFGKQSTNLDVHSVIARPLVAPALQGVSGTVFAYGVTSSGKTHTMMGGYSQVHGAEPGIVPNVVRELFNEIGKVRAQQQSSDAPCFKQFFVRLSMMEIYNEVINDLLQPGQVNLKLLEVGNKGLVVDGLCEQPVTSADEALELIAQGDAYRKVSSTAYNEDSSRSHTICRLHVDTLEVPVMAGMSQQVLVTRLPQQGGGRRAAAVLSLIDLAGSESAKVNQSKGQRMEGSFINKSLLTLGTVIHKLADARGQNQSHVPYRDSKLTRLLQSSMTGAGARIAIVCNITPAAAQFEETGNTLKFATRAKLVQVAVSANDVMDDRTLLRRYRQEAAELRKQLTALLTAQNSGHHAHGHHSLGPGGSEAEGQGTEGGRRDSVTDGSMYGGSEVAILEMESELMDLKFQLEQERALRVKAEQDKKLMETRLRRLTCLLLEKQRIGGGFKSHSATSPPDPAQLLQLEASIKQGREAYGPSEKAGPAQSPQEPSSAGTERPPTPPQHLSTHSGGTPAGNPTATSPGVRNGRFIRPNSTTPSRGVSQQFDTTQQQQQQQQQQHEQDPDKPEALEMDDEAELLAQIEALHGELTSSKHQDGNRLYNSASGTPSTPQPQRPWDGSGQDTGTNTPTQARSSITGLGGSIQGDCEKDFEIQVLLADHEVLQDQIVTVEMSNQRLINNNEQLAAEVAWYKLENEKERRIVRELESDMVELRRFKNETYAQLEALKAEAAEARGRRAASVANPPLSPLPRPSSSTGLSTQPLSPAPQGPGVLGSSSFSSAAGFDAREFGELRAHMASGNAAMPELQTRLEALEKHVLAAVASVIARNRQLEASLSQVSLANQHLQGLGLEGLTGSQRAQLATSLVQAASRLTQGFNKIEHAKVASALQPLQALSQQPQPHHHDEPSSQPPEQQRQQPLRLPPTPVSPPQQPAPSPQQPLQQHYHQPMADSPQQRQQQQQQQSQKELQRVSMHQAEQVGDNSVLVEWDLLGPDEGEVEDEEDGQQGYS